jgi:hypothetical protein
LRTLCIKLYYWTLTPGLELADPFSHSDVSQSTRERGEEMQRAFDWTFQRMDLLSELIDVLSGIIDEWNTFISLNGDVGYFSDLDEFPRSTNSYGFRELGCPGSSLRNIKQIFEKLKTHRQRLESLTESLGRDFEAVR